MAWYLSKQKISGNNVHSILVADTLKELERAARLLRVDVKNSYRDPFPHLDLKPKKRDVALAKGAIEIEKI